MSKFEIVFRDEESAAPMTIEADKLKTAGDNAFALTTGMDNIAAVFPAGVVLAIYRRPDED